jgi:hypothetical protein
MNVCFLSLMGLAPSLPHDGKKAPKVTEIFENFRQEQENSTLHLGGA